MRLIHACAVGAATALLLTGCGSSGGGTKTPPPSASDTAGGFPSAADSGGASDTPPATDSVPTDTTGATDTGGASSGALSAALLADGDVKGFTSTTPDTSSSSLPCTPSKPPLTTQYPPADKAKTTFISDSKHSTFNEEIYQYSNEADATSLIAAANAGFDCTSAKIGGMSARIAAVGELTTTPAADSAEQWDVETSDGTLASFIVARVVVIWPS